VSEESERVISGPEGNGAGVDPTAVALALAGASRERADAFLKDQQALIAKQCALADDQCHHLHEQLKQIHLDLWEKRFGVFLRLATAAVGCGLVLALAVALWNASRADGLVVEAFSVPPQLADAGITGAVVADDLTNRITAIGDFATSNSLRDSRGGVRKDSSEDVKVEIPETGISIGQAWRYLRLWLGDERHLTGNIRSLGDGNIALSVAMDGQEAIILKGPLSDLESLEQRAAEQVFARYDRVNIVLYLNAKGRPEETLAAAERNARLGDGPVNRARGYALWSSMTQALTGDLASALKRSEIAVGLYPNLASGHQSLMSAHYLLGHKEDALHEAALLSRLRLQDQPSPVREQSFLLLVGLGRFIRDANLGAFTRIAEGDCPGCSPRRTLLIRAEFAARGHDLRASRALLAEAESEPASDSDRPNVFSPSANRVRYFLHASAEDWGAAAVSATAYGAQITSDPSVSAGMKRVLLNIEVTPLIAYSQARAGVAGDSAALLAGHPDCYDCVRTLGLIAAAQRNWGEADTWFAKAVGLGPSLPFAYHDWGASLLERNAPDAAIEKFKLANAKGPHFADPLEGWGEALMAKNQSHMALAKFAEAEKFAPNWGRLHLKWGEALVYAGKKDEAKAQFARSAQLDLTPTEKSELARMGHV
jgi:tetratricopeptide (TPR) repeat protein